MEVTEKKFVVESNKIKESKKIIVMGDLHLSPVMFDKGLVNTLLDFLNNKSKISLITIPGDIMYAQQYVKSDCIRKLEYLVWNLREIAPVVLSLGNHDIQKDIPEARRAFRDLSKIRDVYALDNEQMTIDEMRVTGFSPRHDAYAGSNHGDEANKMFVEDFQKSGLTFEQNEFNLLLNHAPHPIASEYAQQKLKELYECVDLIVAGHLHNGYVPDVIERIFKDKIKDYGIWEQISLLPPALFKKVNLCRGSHILGDKQQTQMIVTEGMNRFKGYRSDRFIQKMATTEITINPEEEIKSKSR